MKYVVALIASLALLLLYAAVGATLGWHHGGGYLPQTMLWLAIIGVWGAIVGMWPSSKVFQKRNIADPTAASPGSSPQERSTWGASTEYNEPIDEREYYAQAYAESDTPERRDGGLWAKAFALAQGDDKTTKAKYIELRAQYLMTTEKQRRQSDRLATVAEKRRIRQTEGAKEANAEPVNRQSLAYRVGKWSARRKIIQ